MNSQDRLRRRGLGAGSRCNKITFQTKIETKDRVGATVEDWTTTATFYEWGAIEYVGTSEFPSYQKRNSEVQCRFRIPYRAGIDADFNRILFTLDESASPVVTQVFDIYPPVDADPSHPRREWLIEAREIV